MRTATETQKREIRNLKEKLDSVIWDGPRVMTGNNLSCPMQYFHNAKTGMVATFAMDLDREDFQEVEKMLEGFAKETGCQIRKEEGKDYQEGEMIYGFEHESLNTKEMSAEEVYGMVRMILEN